MATLVDDGARILDTVGPGSLMGREEWRHQPASAQPKREFRVLLSALDALEQCLAFHDGMGRLQHANRAYLDEVGRSGADGEALRNQVSQLAQMVCALAVASRMEHGDRAHRLGERTISTGRGAYHFQCAYVGVGLFGATPSVLITLDPPPADPFCIERLRTQFGLTRAQAKVARLLVNGLRNGEIAQRLFLSEHTVRHHLEQIRVKVGGHTRAATAARLREQA